MAQGPHGRRALRRCSFPKNNKACSRHFGRCSARHIAADPLAGVCSFGRSFKLHREIYAMSAVRVNVLRNSPGFGCWQAAIEGVQLAAAASGAASTPWHLRLTLLERLRHALGGLWWASTNELGEPSEVLRRGGQQHLVPSAAQASQPKPVEFEDALHMRKPHLYFLALAA